MKRKSWKRITAGMLSVLVLFFLSSSIIPPRFHKDVSSELLKTPVTISSLESGDKKERVLSVDDNKEALIWRIRLIESAQEEIVLSSYNMQGDESCTDILAALFHAAERGVHIRILVDGMSGFLNVRKNDFFKTLSALPNVESRFYNPVCFWQPWKLNYRMHDKYLISDRTAYMLGGRNTKNLSLGDYQEQQDYDRDAVVYSPNPTPASSLSQICTYFEQIWNSNETKSVYEDYIVDSAEINVLHDRYQYLQDTYPSAFETPDWYKVTLPANGIKLLSNPINAGNKEPVLWTQLMQLMAQSKNCVVQTPYFICNRKMYNDLTAITNNGTSVSVITNAVESGGNICGCADYLNQKSKILKTGIHIYEYLGDHSAHRKSVILDDRLCLIGSFNFDMRSAYLDTELMLLIDSPSLNSHLQEIAEENQEQSLHLLPDGTSSPGSAYQPQEMPCLKKILYGASRAVILPLRPLL